MAGAWSDGRRFGGGRNRGWAAVLFFSLIASGIQAQNSSGAPFPRTGIFQWGGAPAEWYSKFDLVMTRISDASFISRVKAINPNTIWLVARDFNVADQFYSGFPSDWYLYDSKGNKITIYGSSTTYWANLSDQCPIVNGNRFWEAFPRMLANTVTGANADGIASDGLYYKQHLDWNMPSDIDLDRNGVNDLTEHGKQWVIDHWGWGVDRLLYNLRQYLGNKIIMINTGSSDMPDKNYLNGYVSEYAGGEYNWFSTQWLDSVETSQVMSPFVHLSQQNPDGSDSQRIRPSKNDFPYIRFGLGRAMLLGQYYEYEDVSDHYWNKYYDEFDLNVGYPTGDMQQLISTGVSNQGVWVRFFDMGAVMVNFSTRDVVVTAQQLSALSGYQGPYYRFQGGQDPSTNDGSLFTQVTLKGHSYISSGANWLSGDAIILVKNPTTAISDIIIDNSDSGTSPGSDAAYISPGFTQQGCGSGSDNYTLRCSEWLNTYAFAKASAGTGSATATFRPNIGLPGNYEIFEWHGKLSSSGAYTNEATNVPCIISYSGGSTTLTINQKDKAGKWNSLGQFWFAKGTSGNVTISNNANSDVIADAFKFAYVGIKDTIPPNGPTGLSTTAIMENSIVLSWYAPGAASDGDLPVSYQIYRNDVLAATVPSNTTTYTDNNLTESSTFSYRVFALDKGGNRSLSSTSGTFTTASDRTPPLILQVLPINYTTIDVVFSEPVQPLSAQMATNYLIDNSVQVLSALLTDVNVVRLTTTTHVQNGNYHLVVNNVKDRAVLLNTIQPNSNYGYQMSISSMQIAIAGDDSYQLYVNGTKIGEGSLWNVADKYSIPSVSGNNVVVAVKTLNTGGAGGLVAEIDFKGKHYVTNTSWKLSTIEQTGWNTNQFDDTNWAKATSWGLQGPAAPWSQYISSVTNISTTNNVNWIWTSNLYNQDPVFFRLVLKSGSDVTAPSAPVGLSVTKH